MTMVWCDRFLVHLSVISASTKMLFSLENWQLSTSHKIQSYFRSVSCETTFMIGWRQDSNLLRKSMLLNLGLTFQKMLVRTSRNNNSTSIVILSPLLLFDSAFVATWYGYRPISDTYDRYRNKESYITYLGIFVCFAFDMFWYRYLHWIDYIIWPKYKSKTWPR